MAHVQINPSLLTTLKDKVVVLTGGATGIGRSTVRLFHQYGAKVVFGDVADSHGLSLERELGERVVFTHCDTTKYSDQLKLFKEAEKRWGRIDIAVANAGISLPKDPFLPDEDVETEFSTAEIDVNLKGPLITARIGLAFLRKNGGGDLILVSSIAGWKECTGLVAYTASKHGVVGIMRGLHLSAVKEGVRINVICPWMTKTGMVKGIELGWASNKLPENEPEDVGKAIILCATANRGESKERHEGAVTPFAGKILWVSGGESYEIEDNLQRLEPEWLGRENSAVLKRGQEFLMSEGTSWDVGRSKP
ncbi:putative 15-hydroxyprostaglandin dehydrogenase [Hyaloscypha bicolor E]|uniref:Putative 15-hydroxyprostaglandin dehydrogenase n=1 Tax=Hyaloscypha bicolor E TaxID=1095630 RepID=A0A2J6T4B7_9HELO|nr:putative 15-hydroxyprostaglandin dehydrogenase [Hyaloscypha bicolor E]PMD57849.1 putative 15-hydroxyprostaglandin dehydrogenase [Hyaloscypha bicolor E]